jgi:hypothetical protein
MTRGGAIVATGFSAKAISLQPGRQKMRRVVSLASTAVVTLLPVYRALKLGVVAGRRLGQLRAFFYVVCMSRSTATTG